jgi:ABC-type glycerol-3-phosphate transport system substrate-binding protein
MNKRGKCLIFFMVFLLLFSFSLFAAGEKEAEAAEGEGTAVKIEEGSWEWLKEAGKQYEGTMLRMVSLNATWAEVAKTFLPEFEEMTGIKVLYEPMPFQTIHEKQVAAMAGGTGEFDVLCFDNPWASEYANAGWLEPLDPYVEKYGYDLDWPDTLLDYYSLDGNLIAIPYEVDARMIFYRKDLFEKYDVPLPDTIDDLEDAARVLNQPENGHYGIAFAPARSIVSVLEYFAFLRAYGGSVFDSEMKPTINSDAAVTALEKYVGLIEYAPPGGQNMQWDELLTVMLQGKVAMSIQPSPFGRTMNDPTQSKVVDKVGFLIHPKAEKRVPSIGGWAIGIPKDSKNKEAAWLLTSYLTSPEIEKKRALHPGGSVPGRLSTLSDPEVVAEEPSMEVTGESLEVAQFGNKWQIPEWAQVQDALTLAIANAATGEKSAKAALDEAQETIYDIMEEAGYY